MKTYLVIFGLGLTLISGSCLASFTEERNTEDRGRLVIRSAEEALSIVDQSALQSIQKRLEEMNVWEEFKAAGFNRSKLSGVMQQRIRTALSPYTTKRVSSF